MATDISKLPAELVDNVFAFVRIPRYKFYIRRQNLTLLDPIKCRYVCYLSRLSQVVQHLVSSVRSTLTTSANDITVS
jgi:hypothetical protein